MKRCFSVGHRDAPENLVPKLSEVIEILITVHKVDEFIVGHYGRFDSQVAAAVIEMKRQYRHISLVMLLPYHPAMRPIDLPEGFDTSVYPFELENIPKRIAIVRANRYMIDHADFVVAYAKYPGSNAMKFFNMQREGENVGNCGSKIWRNRTGEQDCKQRSTRGINAT